MNQFLALRPKRRKPLLKREVELKGFFVRSYVSIQYILRSKTNVTSFFCASKRYKRCILLAHYNTIVPSYITMRIVIFIVVQKSFILRRFTFTAIYILLFSVIYYVQMITRNTVYCKVCVYQLQIEIRLVIRGLSIKVTFFVLLT